MKNSRPIIGLPVRKIKDFAGETRTQGVASAYIDSVYAAGGTPLMLPLFDPEPEALREYVRICDGFIFSGGEDISPSRYSENASPELGAVCTERDEFEFKLFDLIKIRKPILAICRGLQFINVALGGSLIQHITDADCPGTCHQKPEGKWLELAHEVKFEPNSKLSQIFGTSTKVNSLHHQGAKGIGENLQITARSDPDGLVEGLELDSKHGWLIAVQWHPEVLWQPTPKGVGQEQNLNLFKALIEAC